MKNVMVLLLAILGFGFTSSAQTVNDRKEILAIFSKQERDWTNGDVKEFMSGYWNSDSLTFVGSKGVTYGYKPTYENYLKRYPNRAAMGQLKFDIIELSFPAKNVAYLIGKFNLTRPEVGDASGHFSVLLKKIKNKWVIVSDHSS